MKKTIAILFLSVILPGCSGYTWIPEQPDNPEYAPIAPEDPSIVPNFNGAIYHPINGRDSLYTDLRAHRVGDVLTIVLTEKTVASKDSNTNTTKVNSSKIADPTIFGTTYPVSTQLNSSNKFDGQGSSDQKNSLRGSITVTVAHVLSNGNLVIRGEKWISLNQGSEYIRLTGIVRPYDIDAENNVLSTKVANPRIAYKGTGALADANQEGWLSRLFTGPIFPY